MRELVAGRTRDVMRPAFPTLGTLSPGITNLRRTILAAGKPSSFRSLLKHLQEPCSGLFVRLQIPPIQTLSCAAADHGNHHDSRSFGNAQKCLGEFRNVVR